MQFAIIRIINAYSYKFPIPLLRFLGKFCFVCRWELGKCEIGKDGDGCGIVMSVRGGFGGGGPG